MCQSAGRKPRTQRLRKLPQGLLSPNPAAQKEQGLASVTSGEAASSPDPNSLHLPWPRKRVQLHPQALTLWLLTLTLAY